MKMSVPKFRQSDLPSFFLQGFASLLLYCLSYFTAPSVLADELPSVLVQTRLNPSNPVVGQQVEFYVDIFVSTWFTRAPEVPEIEIDDAIALLPPSASTNLNKRIGTQSYAGQRRTYYLFPQLPGRYEIPSLRVTVAPALSPVDRVTLSTEATSFMAQLPPELADRVSNPVIVTPKLQVETEVRGSATPDSSGSYSLQVGDTLDRTVTLRAADTLASTLPALPLGETSGLRAYPDPPQLSNRLERGQFQAIRTDRISYIAEQPGRDRLPAIEIAWWNPETQSLETEVIPEVSIRVKPTLKQVLLKLLPGFALLAVFAILVIYYRKPLQQRWQAYLRQREESESAYWRRLHRACSDGDGQGIWMRLSQWLARTTKNSQTVTLEEFLARADDPDLTARAIALEQSLFAEKNDTTAGSSSELYRALSRVRKMWLRQQQSESDRQQSSVLPPLNPMRSKRV